MKAVDEPDYMQKLTVAAASARSGVADLATMTLLNKASDRQHGLAEGMGNRPAFDSMARKRTLRRWVAEPAALPLVAVLS
jgi:hypothetical protein